MISFLAGQAPVLFQMPEPIDEATPKEALTRTGFDGNEYELVFSDEFEVDGRTFWPGEFVCFISFRSFLSPFTSSTLCSHTSIILRPPRIFAFFLFFSRASLSSSLGYGYLSVLRRVVLRDFFLLVLSAVVMWRSFSVRFSPFWPST